jgi:hypothetical protein
VTACTCNLSLVIIKRFFESLYGIARSSSVLRPSVQTFTSTYSTRGSHHHHNPSHSHTQPPPHYLLIPKQSCDAILCYVSNIRNVCDVKYVTFRIFETNAVSHREHAFIRHPELLYGGSLICDSIKLINFIN